MKKTYKALIVLVLLTQITFAQEEQKTPSQVNKATVFLNKAQINRDVKVSLKKGITTLVFNELSPFIDVKSIQVKTAPSINILAVNHKKNYLNEIKKSEQVKALEEKLEAITDKITLENTQSEIVSQNIDFLQKNKTIGGTNQTLTVSNLSQTATYYANQYKKLKLEELAIAKRLKGLYEEQRKINNEINTLSNNNELPTGEIFVKVETTKIENTNFEITYLVDNVSWYPSYDIKAIDINNPLEITYKANLQQNSQVDWNDVVLTFSSDNPTVSGVAPELTPYQLSFNQKRGATNNISYIKGQVLNEKGNPLPGVNVSAKGTNIITMTDFDGEYALSLPNNTKTIQASYLGFETQEKPVTSETLNFRLNPSSESLDEVVVVGYGNQKKNRSVGRALEGKTSGIQIMETRSDIDDYESSPLYVVDGVAMSNNPNLSPDEIKSIDVLKDASATSVYGSRGSDGVIVITTKNGANVVTSINQTAVNFKIEKNQTVKSTVNVKEITLKTLQVPAEYQYYTVPKVNKSAYLTAKIKDWEKYQLLDGETNVFFDNTFKSKGVLDLGAVKEEIIISLGVDKQIDINRSPVTENVGQKFFSKNVETTRHWKVDIKNNKNQPINIQILDQVPVSVTDEIKVEVLNISDAAMNSLSGELKWNLNIPKTTSKTLNIEYLVKHPKDKRLIID
ncbi:mucoidy inhibitor MuiA family protein [Wenyingzhuangia sp. chi5]|uniref:Mucoidy inhibitor MuiA family protein n=1 Tax=Wenyingzhuangia gilva TaxID=3057677 RepID=A0ABT8VSE8_9FLAO|nr:mucoidy inhibitor MuiA family protein [Wenyingzhuangia sp. chi5]MDO3694895.1 mucoidy inhibitor MuiA family protein [Wenyingzhuangia sp. chi5]